MPENHSLLIIPSSKDYFPRKKAANSAWNSNNCTSTSLIALQSAAEALYALSHFIIQNIKEQDFKNVYCFIKDIKLT